jgi:hypothetical protein
MNLVQQISGTVEWLSRSKTKFFPYGFAMNGMTSRLEAVRQIIFGLGVEQIVETGTYRGVTAEWFAQFGIPFETVEFSERYFAFSKIRLRHYSNAKISCDASVHYLQNRVKDASLRDAVTLFYLDAHWLELPLQDELELIFSNYDNAAVLIDDFKVADDEGYGFDNYGPGKAITLEYVLKCRLPPLSVFFPTTKADQETGWKRGWVVLTSNEAIARKLCEINLLRRYPAV